MTSSGSTLARVATYTATNETAGEKVRRDANRGFYILRWHTDEVALDASTTYRIRVVVRGRELGFADVDVVTSAKQIHNIDRNEYVPLVDGRTMPIKFRIESAAVDRDGDGVFDWDDNCPTVANGTGPIPSPEASSSPVPADCKADASACDPNETDCVSATVTAQLDTDQDGTGDACECAGISCAAASACQGAGTCEPTTGTCSYPTLPDSDDDGTCDAIDECPADYLKADPGVCGCSISDVDSDLDFTMDCFDECSLDPTKVAPGICGCGTDDADSDGDSTADCLDTCAADPDKREPGLCGCNVPDSDEDSDGLADCHDGCPSDPSKVVAGTCNCGVPDLDSDQDGVADCLDACQSDSNKTAPGTCGCGTSDADTDSDGTADCNDTCSADASKTAPGTCGCGVSDTDTDGDGTADCQDGCFEDSSKAAPGLCGCGEADVDADQDLVMDCFQQSCDVTRSLPAPATTAGYTVVATFGSDFPASVAIHPTTGEIYVTAYNSGVHVVDPIARRSTLVVSGFANAAGLAFDHNGDLLVTETTGGRLTRVNLATNQKTTVAFGLNGPWGVLVDTDGSIYVAEQGGGRVNRILPDGTKLLVESGLSQPTDMAFAPDGSLHVNEYAYPSQGFATTLSCTWQVTARTPHNSPTGLLIDRDGTRYVASYFGGTITRIAPNGAPTVLAGGFNRPHGLAFDGAGGFYAAIFGYPYGGMLVHFPKTP